ncbi:hypothetical protein [Ottowia sp.]|jgi:hypothetical protein|uniref:hypothetical protein n=1 Tax=Ottowia sp. TaxID=1898956 RepID=UPI0025FF231D|nr:hypothetical protein [Ottowia sp.]MBK6613067.1 hypothetical protein [Ottowia sp.]MBK6747822.1 hypothetical protein [Ottowia sp.]
MGSRKYGGIHILAGVEQRAGHRFAKRDFVYTGRRFLHQRLIFPWFLARSKTKVASAPLYKNTLREIEMNALSGSPGVLAVFRGTTPWSSHGSRAPLS